MGEDRFAEKPTFGISGLDPVPLYLVDVLASLYGSRIWAVPLAALVFDSVVDGDGWARPHRLEFATDSLWVDVEVSANSDDMLWRLTVRTDPERSGVTVLNRWGLPGLLLGQGSPPRFEQVPPGVAQIWLADQGMWVRTDWFLL